MARPADTIAALATPPGASGLAVIRISGSDTGTIGGAALGSPTPPRTASHRHYRDLAGAVLDDVVAVFYAGPKSYTGEDSLEISCHGSPYIASRILADLLERGCRHAQPGEFTQRAFLNGRMDLGQAEAVMDIINARSERALAAARRALEGELGSRVAAIIAGITGALAQVEAHIDFPEEDLPAEDTVGLGGAIAAALTEAERLLATEKVGVLLREGLRVVLLGEPNAGKSSLLNRLLGSERALVSPEPGTTRDFIEERIALGGHSLLLTDTAGLNPNAAGLELRGVERSVALAARADIIVVVSDATRPPPALPSAVADCIRDSHTIRVFNKIDLVDPVGVAALPYPGLAVSALTGEGVEPLRKALGELARGIAGLGSDESVAINVRHAKHLADARASLRSAAAKVGANEPAELVAGDLRDALDALGGISGKVDNERMLDHLFASFCIGK